MVARHTRLVVQLTHREIESQFKDSYFGGVWIFVRPLLLLIVYTSVFGVIWPRDAEGFPIGAYAMQMFCGLSVYNLFSASVGLSCGSVVNRVGFVKQVVFPLEVLPFVQTLSQFVMGAAWFALLLLGVTWVYGGLSWTCLLLPVVLFPLFFLTTGLAWFVASLTVYVRDMRQFVPVVLQILFFATPIFWRLEDLSGTQRGLIRYLYLNPLTGFIEAARDVVIRARLPDWKMLGMLLVASLLVYGLGYLWFRKTREGFADVL